MKKTATILALAGLSMAANPEQRHGAFRTRKIVDHKPLVDSSITLQPAVMLADDEFQIIRMDGGNSGSYDPRFHSSQPTKPQTWTPPTNPKIWNAPPKRELYADDADDELQIIRDGGNSGSYDPRFHPQTTKPKTWTPPTNPKVWNAPAKKELYADDADDEFQIIRMDGGNSGSYDPRFHSSKPTKPQTWTPPTNPKVWIAPPKKELYADDELQIIRMDGGNSGSYDPRFHSSQPTKPQTWTPPTNPKIWNAPPKRELYADDADDELQIIRMDGGNSGSYDPRFHPQTTKPKTWTSPTNPKVWIAPPKRELYADDADDEFQIIRMDGGNSGSNDPRFHSSQPTKSQTWTPPTNPKIWNAPPKRELYADDADDELIALAELLDDN